MVKNGKGSNTNGTRMEEAQHFMIDWTGYHVSCTWLAATGGGKKRS